MSRMSTNVAFHENDLESLHCLHAASVDLRKSALFFYPLKNTLPALRTILDMFISKGALPVRRVRVWLWDIPDELKRVADELVDEFDAFIPLIHNTSDVLTSFFTPRSIRHLSRTLSPAL